MVVKINNNNNNNKFIHISKFYRIRDQSEITVGGGGGGGEGHYLCREGHNFFEQNFGRVTIFFTKIKGGP